MHKPDLIAGGNKASPQASHVAVVNWYEQDGIAEAEIHERLIKATDEAAAKKAAEFGPQMMRQLERAILLQTLDGLWREHLITLEHLRQVIGLRGYGGKRVGLVAGIDLRARRRPLP